MEPETPKVTPYVDRKLRVRQRIFQVISLLLLLIIFWDVYQGTLAWWVSLIAVIIGLGIGYAMGRLVKMRWDAEAERIVTHMDIVGILVIVGYVILAVLRNVLLSDLFSGATLTAITLSVAAGILYGRYLGTRRTIQRVIEKHSEGNPDALAS